MEIDFVTHSYNDSETTIVSDSDTFPCKFCSKQLAPGKIFEHEVNCDMKPQKKI